MAKEVKIKIRDLHKSFGKKQVLNGVDLEDVFRMKIPKLNGY